MNVGRELLMLGGMVLAVYLPKAVPLLLLQGRIPPGVQRWLKYVAPAVLAAMVAPTILAPEGHLTVGLSQLPFLVTFLIALFARRMFVAVAGGLVTLLALVLLGA